MGRWPGAEAHSRAALTTVNSLLPPETAEVATREANLASDLIAEGTNLDEAENLLKRAQSTQEGLGHDAAATIEVRGHLALMQGKLDAAEALLKQGEEKLLRRPGDNTADIAL